MMQGYKYTLSIVNKITRGLWVIWEKGHKREAVTREEYTLGQHRRDYQQFE